MGVFLRGFYGVFIQIGAESIAGFQFQGRNAQDAAAGAYIQYGIAKL